MGWRENLVKAVEYSDPGYGGSIKCDELAAEVLALPAADRIALARELLEETDCFVARDVPCPFNDTRAVTGWNAYARTLKDSTP